MDMDIDMGETLMSLIVTVYEDDPNRLLFFASHIGDQLVAQNAIRRGARLVSGAVMCASFHNHRKLVEYFVKKCDDVNIWNSVLAGACLGNQQLLIDKALKNGADDYETAFECACQGGHISLVKRFLPLVQNVEGGFYLACQSAQHKVIEVLHEHGYGSYEPSVTLTYVTKSGNLRLIKKFLGQRPIHLSTLNEWLIGVSYRSSIKEVQQVLDEGATDRYNACLSAIKGCNDPVIDLLGYCVTCDEAVTACLDGQKRELLAIAQSLGKITSINEEVYKSCLRRRHELLVLLKTRCYDYLL